MDYDALVRPGVRPLRPYRAGTTTAAAKRAFGLDRVIKLSSNENPLGPSPRALAALASLSDVHLYVDDDHAELSERLAQPAGLAAHNVILGHGSNDILLTLFATFGNAGDEVVLADPTFSLFASDAMLFEMQQRLVPLRDGVHDLDAMLGAITPKTKMVVVVDPNNPTSTRVERADFERFVERLPARILLIVDQAYREYMPAGSVDASTLVNVRPGTIVTRTMSKLYGLASLRFGYAFAEAALIDYLQRVRLPFNVSRPAAVAARAALDDHEFLARTLALNEAGKAQLEAAFARLGLAAYPSAANFVALAVPVAADRAYEDLLRLGIIVRSGDKLGMPGRLRITIGTPDENALLIAALERLTPVWNASAAVFA